MDSPHSEPLSVGVYDEPDLIVSGVAGLLAHHDARTDVRTVTASSGADTGAGRVDVVLCDPVGRAVQIEDYLAALAELTSAPVLVFTWSSSPSSVRRVLAAGARGFVSKSASAADLASAVAAVHRGETVSPAPPPTRAPAAPEGGAVLSTRESEVLDLICRGLSNLEIAEQLYVSVNSVKTYVRQIYQKIGVTRRAQAVAWGLAHGY